jgi:hypothetical protein
MVKAFARGRELLTRWHAVCKLVAKVWHGKHDYKPDLPEPKELSLHKCRAVMNDNAAAQTATALVEEVEKAAIEYYGKAEWESMSREGRVKRCTCYKLTCWHHNRNLICEWGIKFMKARVKELVSDDVDSARQACPWMRSDIADVDGVGRAVWKQFATVQAMGQSKYDLYAKGKGLAYFVPWMKITYPDELLLNIPRAAVAGSRQDAQLEVAQFLYLMRPFYVEFLASDMVTGENILEDSLYVQLTSPVLVADIRARCIIFDKIFQQLRFLCNSNALLDGEAALEWGPLEMAEVTDQLEFALEKTKDNGRWLMERGQLKEDGTREKGVFELDDEDAQEKLEQHDKHLLKRKMPVAVPTLASNSNWQGGGSGKSSSKQKEKKSMLVELRCELYSPTDDTNIACTETVVELLEAFAVGALQELRKIGEDYLSSSNGKYAVGNPDTFMRSILAGKKRTNNAAERLFARSDRTKRSIPNIKLKTVGGMIACQSNNTFGPDGDISNLGVIEREGLLYMSHHDSHLHKAYNNLEEEVQHIRKQLNKSRIKQEKLERAEKAFASMMRYRRMPVINTENKLAEAVKGKSEAGTRVVYKNQINIRRLGNCWGEKEIEGFNFMCGFSSDGVDHSLEYLKLHLHEVFKKEKTITWPTDPPIPLQLLARALPKIGGSTKQRDGLEEITKEDGAAIMAKVMDPEYKPKQRQRVWQQNAPEVTSDMVGRYVLYCFDVSKKKTEVVTKWFEGKVQDVAEPNQRYLGKGGKTEKGGRVYGPRWVYVVFDHDGHEDSEMWLHLRERGYYNPHAPRPGAWKLNAVCTAE